MELKNNYKFIYEVIDSANRERTFFATKDNDVNPENDDKVAGPYKIGTYKVVYQKGNKIVGIKEYGQEPEEIVDLSQFTVEQNEPSLAEVEKQIEDRLINQRAGYYFADAEKAPLEGCRVIEFNPFGELKEITYTNKGKVAITQAVADFGGDEGQNQFRPRQGFSALYSGEATDLYLADGTHVDPAIIVDGIKSANPGRTKPELIYTIEGSDKVVNNQVIKTLLEEVITERVAKGEKDFELKITAKVPYIYESKTQEYSHTFTCPVKFVESPIPGAKQVKTEAELIEALNGKEEKIQLTSNITLGNGKDPVTDKDDKYASKKIYTGSNTLSLAPKAGIQYLSAAGTLYLPKDYGHSRFVLQQIQPVEQNHSKLYIDFDNIVPVGCEKSATRIATLDQFKEAIRADRDPYVVAELVELTADIDLKGETIELPSFAFGKQTLVMGDFKFTNGTVDGKQYK